MTHLQDYALKHDQRRLREHPLANATFQEFEDAYGWMYKNHAFWLPIVYSGPFDVILIADDVGGALCEALSPYCKKLFVKATGGQSVSAMRASLARRRLSNVEIVEFDWCGEWPFEDSSIDFLGLIRINAWVSHAKLDKADIGEHILGQVARVLTKTGAVLFADNNPVSFRCIRRPISCASSVIKNRGQLSHSLIAKRLQAMGFQLRKMAGDFIFEQTMSPNPEFLDSGSSSMLGGRNGPMVSSIREWFIMNPLIKRYWPSFLICASCSPQMGLLSRIYRAVVPETKDSDISGNAEVVLKRIVAGNANVTIMIAGKPENSHDDVVMRLATSEDGRDAVSINADALEALKGQKEIPQLMARGEMGGFDYSVEECVEGLHAESFEGRYNSLVDKAVRLLLDIQERSASSVILAEHQYDRLVTEEIIQLDGFCRGRERQDLAVVSEYLDLFLRGSSISLLRTHGDFKLGNVLFTAGGHPCGIIDWEMSDSRGLPLLDIILLVTDTSASELDTKLPAVFCSQVLTNQLRPFLQNVLDEAKERLGVSEEISKALKMIFWIRYLNRQLGWPFKAHFEVAKEWVTDPLRQMAEMASKSVKRGSK